MLSTTFALDDVGREQRSVELLSASIDHAAKAAEIELTRELRLSHASTKRTSQKEPMTNVNLQKNWKVTATLLERARRALPVPTEEQEQKCASLLAEYKNFFEHNEFGLAFDTLEQVGHLVSRRGGFWRDLERAAENMGLMDRLPAIRKSFSDSLLRNDDLRICCDAMAAHVNWNCPDHTLASDCPDVLIGRFLSGRYGIYIHDGGGASVDISYCPWCGTALTASK